MLVLGIISFLTIGGFIPGRKLTESELRLAKEYYPENLDLSKVRVTVGTIYTTFSTVTLGNRIHLKTYSKDLNHFKDLTETFENQEVLIHELMHVYQFQNGGFGYVPRSLYAQLIAQQTTGSRNGAYDWETQMHRKTPWNKWNPEQQAQAISDYHYYRVVGFDSDKQGSLAKELGCFVPQLKKQFCIK